MTPKPTHELFLERMAYSGRRHPLTHPCAQSCSGYSQGVDDGAYGQSARTEPITKANAEILKAVDAVIERYETADAKNGSDLARGVTLGNYQILLKARNELRRVLEKGER